MPAPAYILCGGYLIMLLISLIMLIGLAMVSAQCELLNVTVHCSVLRCSVLRVICSILTNQKHVSLNGFQPMLKWGLSARRLIERKIRCVLLAGSRSMWDKRQLKVIVQRWTGNKKFLCRDRDGTRWPEVYQNFKNGFYPNDHKHWQLNQFQWCPTR